MSHGPGNTDDYWEVAVQWPDGRVTGRHHNDGLVLNGKASRHTHHAHKGARFVRRWITLGSWEPCPMFDDQLDSVHRASGLAQE